MNTQTEKDLLNLADSAKYLGITKPTLSVYLSHGKFTKHYKELRVFLQKDELDAYLKNKRYVKNNISA